MGARLERAVRRVAGVVSVTMTGERIYALVEPDADPIAVERAIVALFQTEGWRGRITVLGGRRPTPAARPFPLSIPRRTAMIVAPIAAAMAMMVATLTGGTSTPIAPAVPKPAPGFAAPARATDPVGVDPAADSTRTASGGGGVRAVTLPRAVPRVPVRLPKIPAGVTIPKPKPVQQVVPGFKPNPKPVPAPDADPQPAPVPPKPKPEPAPVPAPPPVDPAPAPPKNPPPPDDEDDRDDDDGDDDDQKPRGKSGKPRDDTKKIGHDEAGKHPNHQEHNGDKHGARESKDRR